MGFGGHNAIARDLTKEFSCKKRESKGLMMEQTCGLVTDLWVVGLQPHQRSLQQDVKRRQVIRVRMVLGQFNHAADYIMDYLNMAAYAVDFLNFVNYFKVMDQDYVKVTDVECLNKPMDDVAMIVDHISGGVGPPATHQIL